MSEDRASCWLRDFPSIKFYIPPRSNLTTGLNRRLEFERNVVGSINELAVYWDVYLNKVPPTCFLNVGQTSRRRGIVKETAVS